MDGTESRGMNGLVSFMPFRCQFRQMCQFNYIFENTA